VRERRRRDEQRSWSYVRWGGCRCCMERVLGWIYRRFGERAERDGMVVRRNRNRTAWASIRIFKLGK
jgi:hypothetical protein